DGDVAPVYDRPGASKVPAATVTPPRHPLRGGPPGERNSLLHSGLNDFRNVVSKADDLDEPPAPPTRAPRESYGNASPIDFDQNRPPYESGGDDEVLQDVPPPELLEPSLGMDEAGPGSSRGRLPPGVRAGRG